jgi:hypothetical protein
VVKDKVEIDRYGYMVTDKVLMTSLPGLFAAGDARAGSTKQAAERWVKARRPSPMPWREEKNESPWLVRPLSGARFCFSPQDIRFYALTSESVLLHTKTVLAADSSASV